MSVLTAAELVEAGFSPSGCPLSRRKSYINSATALGICLPARFQSLASSQFCVNLWISRLISRTTSTPVDQVARSLSSIQSATNT